MNINFDIFGRRRIPSLILCNPNGQEIYTIPLATDRKLSCSLNELSELTFTVPKFVNTDEIAPYYDYITTKRIIKLEEFGQFSITRVETESEGVEEYKKITCKGLEIEFASKNLDLLEGTYNFYDPFSQEKSLLHIIMGYMPTWKIGEVDGELLNIWRTFDIKDTNIYNFIMGEVSNAYDCVFLFDTFTRTVSVKKTRNLKIETDIFLSNKNLMKTLNISEDSDNIVTALNVYGDGDLSIRTVNPLGTPTIYDYSYFMKEDWMSLDLISALTVWQDKVKQAETNYANILTNLKNQDKILLSLKTELKELETQKKAFEQHQGMAVVAKDDASCSYYNSQIKAKEAEIVNKNNQIKAKEEEIETIKNSLVAITKSLSFENNFTREQIEELDNLTFQSSIQNTNYAITDSSTYEEQQQTMYDLYNYAKEELKKQSQPIWEFSIDVINFLNLIEYKEFSNQLVLGGEVTIEVDKKKDLFAKALLIGYEIDLDDFDDLELNFCSVLRYSSASWTFDELFDSVASISRGFDFESSSWSKGKEAYSMIDEYVHSALNLTNQEIKATDNQEFVLSNVGLRGREYDPKTDTYLNEQIWMTKNVLAFSDDGFNTTKMALGKITLPDGSKAYGLIGDYIVGKMLCGKSLVLENEQSTFKVDANGVYIKDANILMTSDDGTVQSIPEMIDVSTSKIDNVLTDEGLLDTNKMQGQILAGTNNIYCVNSSNNKALIINDTGILIANSKSSGSWNWRTAISADGIVADIIQANSTLSGVNIRGGSLNIGNGSFTVDTVGNVNITKGSIKMGNGNFTANNDGTVAIKKGSINLGNGNFVVDSTGTVSMKKGSININNGAFRVDSNGNVYANSYHGLNLGNSGNVLTGAIDFNNITVRNLRVGENVFMSPSAVISWDNVAHPNDLAYQSDIPSDSHITRITQDTVSTMYIVADEIDAEDINGGEIYGSTLRTGGGVEINRSYISLGNGSGEIDYSSGKFKFYSSRDISFDADDIWFEPYGAVRIDGDLRISGSLYINNVELDSYTLRDLIRSLGS